MNVKFYLCLTCGNIVCKVVDSGVTPQCCGSDMVLLEPKSVDNSMEKHLPVVEQVDDCTVRVKVGAVPHPCTAEHRIEFIALESEDGINIKVLDNEDCQAPVATFCSYDGEAIGVYSYCNLHGLWYQPL